MRLTNVTTRTECGITQGNLPGDTESGPEAANVERHSAKTVEEWARISRYDGHKCSKGRTRHLLADILGLPIASYITPAGVHDDTVGARKFLRARPSATRHSMTRPMRAAGRNTNALEAAFERVLRSYEAYQAQVNNEADAEPQPLGDARQGPPRPEPPSR